MNFFKNIIKKHPQFKKVLKFLISSLTGKRGVGYRQSKNHDEILAIANKNGWKSKLIPSVQRGIVDVNLAAYFKGKDFIPFDVLVEHLKLIYNSLNSEEITILEVGCSTGYNYEALKFKGLVFKYEGCDFSREFIELARRLQPSIKFSIEDAVSLGYESNSFDVVISGNCLLHILDYESAIKEAARVAREYVIFHVTPVLHLNKTTYFIKKAYGLDVVEIHFNENELISLFYKYGLVIVDVKTLYVSWVDGDAYINKNFLCKKIKRTL
jgi:ubiquinone/menaquinone biosynthesis C-methylase UbiE